MKVLSIGTKGISFVESSLKKLKSSNISFETLNVESDFDKFFEKCLFDKDFYKSIKSSDIVVVDAMILKDLISQEDNFNFYRRIQKFFYFIYSINRATSCFLSFYFFDKQYRIKNLPTTKYENNFFDILAPDSFYKASELNDPEILIDLKHAFFNLNKKVSQKKTKITSIVKKSNEDVSEQDTDDKISRIQKILEKKSKNIIIK
tara:strand:- start:4530 stop:5141 length:612 start_codon:yes stop_codon:yes gene_type:complete